MDLADALGLAGTVSVDEDRRRRSLTRASKDLPGVRFETGEAGEA